MVTNNELLQTKTIFETKRTLVRQYIPEDEEDFYQLNGNIETMRYIRPVKDRIECAAFLKQTINDYSSSPLSGHWAVMNRLTSRFIGSFAFIPEKGTNEMQVGYALLPPFWGLGYATELTKAGLDYVFYKTGLNIVYAYAEKENVASLHVLTKAGMELIGEKEEGRKVVAGFCKRFIR
jgi:ribosomal-protein-alanine N-acetyltransferase